MEKQRASKNFAILGTTSVLVKILAIIYLPFQARILGYYGNGVAADGYNIWTFMFSLANAGLPNALSKMVSEHAATGNFRAVQKILKCAYLVLLGFGVVCACLMAFGAKFIATRILGVKDAYLMLLTISPTLIFTSVSCALRGYYQGRQNMMPVAVSNVIEQLLNSVFTVVFAWALIRYGLPYGVAGTTIGTFVGAFGAAGFLCFVFFGLTGRARKAEAASTRRDAPELPARTIYREIFRYSFPAVLNTVAVCASPLIDSANCIARLQAAHFSYAQATSLFGVYSYQYQRLFTLAIAFSTALVTAMIPSVSEALALRDHRLVKHRVYESYKAIYLVTIPGIAGISFLAQPLITLVFYRRNSGAELVAAGTWTAIFMVIMYVQTGALIAAGNPVAPSVNLIVGMVLKTLLNDLLIAIPSVNIYGAIIGTGAGYLIAVALNELSMRKIFRFRIPIVRMMLRPALASAVTGAVCLLFYTGAFRLLRTLLRIGSGQTAYYALSDGTVVLAAGLGAGLYFALMILVGGATRGDILRLPMGGRIYRAAVKFPVLRRRLEA